MFNRGSEGGNDNEREREREELAYLASGETLTLSFLVAGCWRWREKLWRKELYFGVLRIPFLGLLFQRSILGTFVFDRLIMYHRYLPTHF